MQSIITLIIAIVGSNGLWTLINTVLSSRKKKRSVENEALLALLHDKIYFLCTNQIKKGYITVDELENINYLWRPYHQLGGNGTGERLYKQCCDLPIKEVKDEA